MNVNFDTISIKKVHMILCSSSPTRAKLLKRAGLEFIQKSCSFDEESIVSEDPYEFVSVASLGKFKACIECFKDENIVAADTVVTDGREILRKANPVRTLRIFY